jgi:hypothetical protein
MRRPCVTEISHEIAASKSNIRIAFGPGRRAATTTTPNTPTQRDQQVSGSVLNRGASISVWKASWNPTKDTIRKVSNGSFLACASGAACADVSGVSLVEVPFDLAVFVFVGVFGVEVLGLALALLLLVPGTSGVSCGSDASAEFAALSSSIWVSRAIVRRRKK